MKIAGIVIFSFIILIAILSFGLVNVHPTEVAVEINKVAGEGIEKPKRRG